MPYGTLYIALVFLQGILQAALQFPTLPRQQGCTAYFPFAIK